MMACPICGAELVVGMQYCPACGTHAADSVTGALKAGRVLAGRYRVVRLIARGGMGAVYLAVDLRLDEVAVAVKEMASLYRLGETDAFAQAVSEFRREAALLARLSHPNLPRVIDRFEEDGKHFLVMEFVEGQTLREVLSAHAGKAPLSEVYGWAKQLCAVLGYLHAQQPPIVYRDLKPSNVMVRSDGRLALIDFGIARFYKPGKSSDTAIYGTLGYAAPEQYGEGQTDPRSDIYAFGVLLFHALTGYDVTSTPFHLPSLCDFRPETPGALAKVIARATALNPADRFASVAELLADLDHVLLSVPSPTDPVRIGTDSVLTPGAARRSGLPLWMFGTWIVLGVGLLLGLRFAGTGSGPQSAATSVATPWSGVSVSGTALPTSPLIGGTRTPPPDMVAVPEGPFSMGLADDPDAQPVHTVDLGTFWIDKTEVTNQAYRACVQSGICAVPQPVSSLTHEHYYDSAEFARYPVVNITWEAAQTFCRWHGRRLPTEAEWEKAARGTDARLYPWGNSWDPTRVQLLGADAGTSDLSAVGSFPQNASPYGALDMSGNVWEWTSSRNLPYPYASTDGREVPTISGDRVVRGGSWGRAPRHAQVTTRDPKDPSDGFWNRGFRCAVTPDGPVLNSEGKEAQPMPLPVGMLPVPRGILTIGTSEVEAQRWNREYGWNIPVTEFPQHSVTVGAFALDQTEVTNQQYAAFVAATGHAQPRNSFDPEGLAIWHDQHYSSDLAQHPVVNVTWGDARAYCAWAGKRLPTEAEWEWAAKGPEGWLWPWGQIFDQQHANTKERGIGGTMAVGSDPGNASWVGALDMGGNVWEWISSLGLPYPYDPADGREDPGRAGAHVIRGGSWTDRYASAHTTGRSQFDPALSNVNIGFRCAR